MRRAHRCKAEALPAFAAFLASRPSAAGQAINCTSFCLDSRLRGNDGRVRACLAQSIEGASPQAVAALRTKAGPDVGSRIGAGRFPLREHHSRTANDAPSNAIAAPQNR
jgi:hypothetical protein